MKSIIREPYWHSIWHKKKAMLDEGILLTPELTSGVLHRVPNNEYLEHSIVYLIINIWSTPLCA